jgi:hypothetical protein
MLPRTLTLVGVSNTSRMRQRRRDMVNQMKVEAGCADCGNKHPAVLDFHHNKPRNGDESQYIPRLISETVGLERLMAAIAECTILCANCHRIRHYTAP